MGFCFKPKQTPAPRHGAVQGDLLLRAFVVYAAGIALATFVAALDFRLLYR